MKKLLLIIIVLAFLSLSINAQTSTATSAASTPATESKPKKPIFRATKAQITEAQKMLKDKGLYSGEATGKMEDTFRTAVKAFQRDNGLKQTGTLNRSTLEKMNIALTDAQKAIPAPPDQMASTDASGTDKTKTRKPVFRATKEQIMEAQRKLKAGTMYAGEETGKLDDPTREGIKKFQAANGVKVTGTLNKETLEKMGIALTDKQKEY
ncbi:MAG: peptidoglycan-binding protein [Pyrinomonadaceae bacterium]|nr:peptidoglycan-binding protein [Pyrinomonadaceae bacterium]